MVVIRCSFVVVDGVVMNALFATEAKRFPLLSQPCRAACRPAW